MLQAGFDGERVVIFESRRAPEMASLVARHGGAAFPAPALREVALPDGNPAALAFARDLEAGAYDAVILMTGVGTRALVEEVAPALDRAAFAAALARVPLLIARGPKPAAALRDLAVRDFVTVEEPNTWREVAETTLARLRAREGATDLHGRRVAVQEHGAPSAELYDALIRDGAEVTPVPAYRWALPEDTAPLRAALHAIAAGRARVALFTSRAQVEHAFAVAAEEGIAGAVRDGLRAGVVGSIGPVCTEALRAEGIAPDVTPEHPRMGHLVKATAERAGEVLRAKRG